MTISARELVHSEKSLQIAKMMMEICPEMPFIVLVFEPKDERGRAFYLSNCHWETVLIALQAFLASAETNTHQAPQTVQ